MKVFTPYRKIAILLVLSFTIAACGGPDEKKMKFFNKGMELYEKNDFVRARLEFKNALQIDPNFAKGYYMLGMVELKAKNYRGAYQNFSKAVKIEPQYLECQLELGKLFLSAKQLERAHEKADLVLAKAPDNIDALALKAAVFLRQDKPDEAIALLERPALRADLKSPEVYGVLAAAYSRKNMVDRAEAVLKNGIEKNPQMIALRLQLARMYLKNKKPDAGIAQLKKTIELFPEKNFLKYQLADLYWGAGRLHESKELINRVIAANPDSEISYLRAAGFYAGKKQFADAQKILMKGLKSLPDSFKLRFFLSRVYVQMKDSDKAFAVLQECLSLKKDPQDPQIVQTKTQIARLYLLVRQVDEAEKYIDEVIADNPKSTEGRFIKGQILLMKGNGADAVSEFRSVVNENPRFIKGYLKLAQAHMMNHQIELALDTLGNAQEIEPGSDKVLRAFARVYTLKKDYRTAEDYLRKIFNNDPKNFQAGLELGDFLFLIKDYSGAQQKYQKVIRIHPRKAAGYLRLSRLYAKQGRRDDSLKILETGYQENPDSATLFNALARAYVQNKKPDSAIALCNKAIDAHPEKAIGYMVLGQVYESLKEYRQAETALQRAVAVQPSLQLPYNMLARLYLIQGDQSRAVEQLKALHNKNPDNPAAYLSMGYLYQKSGDVDNAENVYRQVLENHPRLWVAANNLAFLMAESSDDANDLDEALSLAEKANNLRPGEGTVLDTLGWVQFKRGDISQAVANIGEALEKSPDSPSINYHMAVVLDQSGRQDEAVERLQRALMSDDFAEKDKAEKLMRKISH